MLDAGFAAFTRSVNTIVGLIFGTITGIISVAIRITIVVALLASLIIGLSFIPQVSASVPGLKTVSTAALKAVSAAGKQALQRVQEWRSGTRVAAPAPSQTSARKSTGKTAQSPVPVSVVTRTQTGPPLMVKSTPGGATVQLNSRTVGKTPLSLKVAPGTYRVTVSRPGYGAVTRTVTVAKRKPLSLTVNLTASRPREAARPVPKQTVRPAPKQAVRPAPKQAAPPSTQKVPAAGTRAGKFLEVGAQAPAIVLRDRYSVVHRLSDLRGRQATVLFVWNLDTQTKRLINELDGYVRIGAGDRPALVVVLNGDRAALQKFVMASGVRVPVLLGDREIARAYGVPPGTTVLYAISGSGHIAQRQVNNIQLGLVFRQRDDR